jgi:hypothetical protein
VIHADLRNPEVILGHPETRRMIDFGQPVAVLLSAVLHFIPDSDSPARILETLRAPLAAGSYIAISHGCRDTDPEMSDTFNSIYSNRVAATSVARTRDEIGSFFDGFDLVPPGLVWVPEWRPDSPADVPENPAIVAAVGGVGKLGEDPETAGAGPFRDR